LTLLRIASHIACTFVLLLLLLLLLLLPTLLLQVSDIAGAAVGRQG
jgi:hypothetical protein